MATRPTLTRPLRVLPVVYDPPVVLNGVKTLSYAANMLARRQADEAFLASTGRHAQPIATLGDTLLPQAPGPLTLHAQRILEQAIAAGVPASARCVSPARPAGPRTGDRPAAWRSPGE